MRARIVLTGALLLCSAALRGAETPPPAPASLPPQPREWMAPSVDLTPPPATARWNGSWRLTRPLPEPLAGHRALAVGNRVYVLGGATGRESLGTRDVRMAAAGKGGSLSAWKKLAPLPSPAAFGAAVTARGRLYWLGGSSREGLQIIYDRVWSARIKADGSIEPWREERPLPEKLQHAGAAVLNDRLYVLGGFNTQEYTDAVRFAPVNPDGTLGPWKETARYPHRIGRTLCEAVGGILVVAGGLWSDSQGEHISSLMRAGRPDEAGEIAAWEDMGGLKIASRSLRFSLAEHAGTSDGTFVYAAGGRDPDSQGVPTVQASWLEPRRKALTRWQSAPELPLLGAKGAPQPARVYSSAAVTAAGHFFVLGGFLYVREATDRVWALPLAPYREPSWLSPRK